MRNALGKGLAQLLGQQEVETGGETNTVPLSAIQPNPNQPRKHFEEAALAELAASIKTHGIMQPIVVRETGHETYEIIAGERRWRAAHLAGLTEVPVVVRSASNLQSLQLALIENLQREDIAPLECAQAYQALLSQHGMTQDEVAQAVGKSRSAVANTMRLLKLAQGVREALASGRISEGHARAILQFDTEPEQMLALSQILQHNLSVREAERLSQRKKPRPRKLKHRDNLASSPVDTALSEFFGTPTRLTRAGNGGRIEVEFFSEDDLDRILETLGIRL